MTGDLHPGESDPPSARGLPEPLPTVTKVVHVPEPRKHGTRRATVGFLRSPNGCDASLRLLQYALRLALTHRSAYFRRGKLPADNPPVRLLAIVSLLAAARRLLALYRLLAGVLSLEVWTSRAQGAKPATWKASDATEVAVRILLQSLDVATLVSSNVYLLGRLGILPISPRQARRFDKASDFTTLLGAGIGLAHIARKRRSLYKGGRTARRLAVEAETELEELDFWEDNAAARGGPVGTDKRSAEERAHERLELRHRVRKGRHTLRALKQDLNDLWWERLRLGADGLFALYDALELSLASETVKSWAGITSALIEFSQAWAQHLGQGSRHL
ncbi:hypothetical protein BMF94_1745 [Rhodotorula taiwanensis]|uniref:Uncharacterized protein n=1 Tax=Rhodotorula taiwanensis TaxID=741276 RepID=A0A2S5BEB4_9BASI|nr:hypothetical protein BMF94_1745 [Rhodotorula taiwanensis]